MLLARHFLITCAVAGTFLVTLLAFAALGSHGSLDRREYRVAVSDGWHVDYSEGHWSVNGQRVPLYCPHEDSCQVQAVKGYVWVFI